MKLKPREKIKKIKSMKKIEGRGLGKYQRRWLRGT